MYNSQEFHASDIAAMACSFVRILAMWYIKSGTSVIYNI